jgi:ParB family chromosome partitioning protein
LALTEDHELQERLWGNTPEWQRNGATFRRLITGNEINIRADPLAKFVGMEAYEGAGGLIRRDLLGDEDEGYMQDAELLESLALEKLNQAVESVKEEGFAWIQVRTQFDYSDRAEFGRARTVRRKLTEEEQARMDALTAEIEALEAEFEAYDGALTSQAKSMRDWRKKQNEFNGSWIGLANRLNNFLRMILQLPVRSSPLAMTEN